MKKVSRASTVSALSGLLLIVGMVPLCAGIMVFYAPDCEECFAILNDSAFLQLENQTLLFYDVNVVENYELLLNVEVLHKRRSDDFPAVVTGDTLLFGDEILPNIRRITSHSLGAPVPESLLAATVSQEFPRWEESVTDTTVDAAHARIYIAFFTETACIHCARI
jgi:hypothetical protein